MKIGIIGAGSVGLLCAAYLAEKNDITLFTHRKSQATTIKENGLVLEIGSIKKNITIQAEELKQSVQSLGQFNLILVTVKQYHLTDLLPLIKSIQTNFLFLQNGMPMNEIHNELSGKINFGIVTHGAQRISDYVVRHNGVGKIVIGSELAGQIQLNELSIENFPFEEVEDIHLQIRNKLIVNAIVNPITAVYRVKNGEIVHNAELNNLKNQLALEIFQILQIDDINDQERQLNNVNQICLYSAENKSSMLQDIENRRQTEVDSILGYLLRQANELQIEAPLVSKFYRRVKELS
ncbi:MAG: panE [Bacillales bacterium]|jgi:2-dehydropantoate 2-reductase|nr:panE [Bacillales bacterium]